MTTSVEREQAIGVMAIEALALAVSGDGEGAVTKTREIALADDGEWLYPLCVAWAEVVRGLTGDAPGLWSVQAIDSGRSVEPEDLSPDERHNLFAARFVAAHGNGEADSTVALFNAVEPELLPMAVIALLCLAAGVVRSKA